MADIKGFMNFERNAKKRVSVSDRIDNHEEQYQDRTTEIRREQASRCMDCGVPFCMTGCPLGNLAPEWNELMADGRWKDAIKMLHSTNNFPEFTGRVCPALCENACSLGITDPPVTIHDNEQEIADKAFEKGWVKPRPPKTRTDKKVAVIGGGPAGLAAAQQLNRAGHTITVFEKKDRAGGLLMYGIPHYKIRKEIVQRRIDILEAEGIVFKYNKEIGKTISFDDIKNDFDAIVISTGSETPRDLACEGRETDGVHFAMEFLPQQNRVNWGDKDIAALHPEQKEISAKDKNVIVVGGGDTGSDCIGTSLRQGAKSVLNLELMPEPPVERAKNNPWPQFARIKKVSSSVEELLDAGGEVQYCVSTKKIESKDGKITKLQTIKIDWSKGRPEEIPGTEETHDCDLALLAMGFLGPNQGLLKQIGCKLTDRGNIDTDATRMTSIKKVFAAGDCRRGQSLVVWAIAEGREIARQVDTFLTEKPSALPEVRLEAFRY